MTTEIKEIPAFRKGDLVRISMEGVTLTVLILGDHPVQKTENKRYMEVYQCFYFATSIPSFVTERTGPLHWFPTTTHKDVEVTFLGRLDD